MLIYTPNDKRLIPAKPNVLCLRTPTDGYVYVSTDTYDQAVILNEKYWNDIEGLTKLIGSDRHATEVEQLRAVLPEPVNILSGFLSIIEDNVTFDGSIEELVGCLHVISASINFHKFIKVNPAIRADVTFSDHIRREYELQWEQFINESVPYSMIYEVFAKDGTFANAQLPKSAPANVDYAVKASSSSSSYTPTPAMTKHQEEVVSNLDVSVDGDSALAAAFASDPAFMAAMLGIEEEEGEDMNSIAAMSDAASEAEEEVPEAESGIDELEEWGL